MDEEAAPRYPDLIVRYFLACLILGFALFCPAARADDSFKEGFVTRIADTGGFDVNGVHVLLGPKTTITLKSWEGTATGARSVSTKETKVPALFLGERVEVYGDVLNGSTEIRAKRILFSMPVNRVSGIGIIDLVPPSSLSNEGRLFRADGYIMLLPAKVGATFASPLKSLDDVRTNQWIRYHGTQRPDGIVVLDKADFSPNTINHREDRLRMKTDYDPSVIDKGDAQSGASKLFQGKDIKRLPAWHDAAMQERVERIGSSLIPAFQKALSEDDPTRIDFRFQVIDQSKQRDSRSMPSGIVLVPYQLVERLPDDSQLAAVLAISIAEVLEKEDLRTIPTTHKMLAANIAGAAASAFVPGVELVPSVANFTVVRSAQQHAEQQIARVSLWLLHDAGYDITQAPMAWWSLAAKTKGDPLPKDMPDRSAFLYQALGSTWQPKSTAWQLGVEPSGQKLSPQSPQS